LTQSLVNTNAHAISNTALKSSGHYQIRKKQRGKGKFSASTKIILWAISKVSKEKEMTSPKIYEINSKKKP